MKYNKDQRNNIETAKNGPEGEEQILLVRNKRRVVNAGNVAHVLQLPPEQAEPAVDDIARVSIDGAGVLVPAGRTRRTVAELPLRRCRGELMNTGAVVA